MSNEVAQGFGDIGQTRHCEGVDDEKGIRAKGGLVFAKHSAARRQWPAH